MTRAASAVPRRNSVTKKWEIVVDAGPDPKTGKRRQVKRRGFKLKKDALAARDQIRGQARDAAYVRPTKETVRDYLTRWIATLDRRPSRSTAIGDASTT